MSRQDAYVKTEDDDDANEDVDETNYKTQKDAILFAIDVSASMLERPPLPAKKSKSADRDSAVSAALRCAYQIMQQRIIAQPKDRMGVLFFGTDKSKFRADDGDSNENDEAGSSLASIGHISSYPHCYLFMDLDVPAAEDVRTLKEMVEDDEDPDGVLEAAPEGESVAMANVLFCANQIFTTNAPNFGSRRLFLITDNDDPHPGDKAARSAAAVRAKDLYDLGVVIELFPITRGDAKFNLSKFYDDIIYRDPMAVGSDHVMSVRSGNGLSLLGSLISNINAKRTPKRAYFSNLTFEIAPGLCISVHGYLLLNHQKPARTCYVWVDGDVPLIASVETAKVDKESARTVEASETKKAYKFGGEYVYFTPEERDMFKKWEFPEDWKGKGLRIIGFKPRVMIPLWASVKKSVFIYPSEEEYVGSTRVFSALWQKLKRSEKVAIAWFVPRVNVNPVLVAIMPSDGADDGEGDKEQANPMWLPAGLWLYPLPFSEDIRKFDDSRPVPLHSEELTEMMKPVIENLFLPKMAYNPAKYPNPALQWHYTILQKVALGEEVPEVAEDLTLPKYKAITKRVGGSLAEIKERVESDAAHLKATRAIKREAEEDVSGPMGKPLSKRPRTADAGRPAMSTTDVRAAVKSGTLATKTVAELRVVLLSKGLSSAGKKGELLERLEQWAEEQA